MIEQLDRGHARFPDHCSCCKSGNIVGERETLGCFSGPEQAWMYSWRCLNCGWAWSYGRVEKGGQQMSYELCDGILDEHRDGYLAAKQALTPKGGGE